MTACQYRQEHGKWPDLSTLRAHDRTLPARDRWQGEFVFEVLDDEIRISCAGPDGCFGSADDVVAGPLSPDH